MTAESIKRDFIGLMFNNQQKQKPNYYNENDISSDEKTSQYNNYVIYIIVKLIFIFIYIVKKVLVYLYIILNFLGRKFIKATIKLSIYIASLYKPTIIILDNITTITLKYCFEKISIFSYNLSVSLYKYWKEKKYYKVKVGEKKYSEMDLACMASWIWDFENLTLKDIQDRFTIWYDTAIKVRDMRSDRLRMIKYLKEFLDLEKESLW